MPSDNPAKESLELEQRAQRHAALHRDPDAELSAALEGTFPASDPVSVQAPVTAGSSSLAEWVVDETEEIAESAGERVTELQHMLADEIRARPLIAVSWALAAGAILGFLASR
ncbi:hypothetical protein AXW83_12890 [Bosea sp. PAMC 26642]|nr:hypothetical protein AXW83_12890 [Bosea sp. PAMC 26642]